MKEILCDEDGLQVRRLRDKAEELKSKNFGKEVRFLLHTRHLMTIVK